MYFEFYLFGIENPEKFLDGERPVLKEHGPFIYKKVFFLLKNQNFLSFLTIDISN